MKKIAIIGAGLSGLVTIAALKEVGLHPVCFEASDQLGGAWNYREESKTGRPSIMPTTVSTSSKEMGAFSDLPPPKDFSPYMSHREMLQYLQLYAREKDCLEYIQFNSEVTLVKRADDYDLTGQFLVTYRGVATGQVTTDAFDGVVVASGHLAYPRTVSLEGQERFEGFIVHSHGLKRVDQFRGKDVVIVGSGCSGLDAAEVISSVAKSVYLSCRSGFISLCRQGENGYPLDSSLLRRYLHWTESFLPSSFRNWYVETFYADARFDRRLYRVPPKHGVLWKRGVVLNDAIGSKLLSGTVVQKPGVDRLTENGVHFVGEDADTAVDAVVMATGYELKLPFIEEGLLDVVFEDGWIDLYKSMYPARLPRCTLAFVGFASAYLGPDLALFEMQSRHVAQVFSGRRCLPSQAEMSAEVAKRRRENASTTMKIEFLPYMDDLASEIGCKPNLAKHLTDLPLFLKLVFGPVLPYEYRLEGPNKWGGARGAVFTSEERLLYPLVHGKMPNKGLMQAVFEYLGNLIPSPRSISDI